MSTLNDWVNKDDLKLGIATDHGGLDQKKALVEHLCAKGVDVVDLGPYDLDLQDDYTDYAVALSSRVANGQLDCGVLICRSGVGMSIAANRFHGVRAALVENADKAVKSREHNASNVLVTAGDNLSSEEMIKVVDSWLMTPYSAQERHSRRLCKIETETDNEVAAIRVEDPEIASCITAEAKRQEQGIELIASENFASAAVRAAMGTILTNKYAEGYPGKRYYNGCEHVDEVESIAIERACKLFGAEAANVQSHSGSQANMAAYMALIEPGDKVLAMSLAHGGHLTHGLSVNFSGKFYDFAGYGVSRESEKLDYDEIAELALRHKPKLIMAGASAYPRTIDFARFREIADSVGAYLVVDMAHIAGLVATKLHQSPVPYADVVTSTTHKTLRGPRGGLILCKDKFIKKINSRIFPGIQGGPLMHVIAGKAVCFKEAMEPSFKNYQKQVIDNAAALAVALQNRGFRIVSGGTDNHLILVDMRPKNTTGDAVATALDRAGITANKNLIPFDPEKPTVTSGLRLGTPAVTTRRMKEAEMEKIAEWITAVAEKINDKRVPETVKKEVVEFMSNFPMPGFQV